MKKDSEQTLGEPKQFRLGHLGNLNQVIVALGQTIRAMANGQISTQDGARICSGLGILRTALETATLEQIERRLDELEGLRRPRNRFDTGLRSLQ